MLGLRRVFVSRLLSRQLVRTFADAAPDVKDVLPPLLLTLRADLKKFMKAKEKEKLNVVKAILAEVTNAAMAQPPAPVKSDTDILKILNSMEKKHKIAIESFQTAARQDLVDKEQSQLEIVKQYASQVPILTTEELNKLIEETIPKLKEDKTPVNIGTIVRDVTAKAKEMGRPVLGSDIAAAAKIILAK
ncbi:hypothetical protein TWF694_004081 [Orbilia ellipsospora]|uniref:Altered inheritance of mitochondria protein 41 n=1 Tax=Orbilia ellipsospora TaxID=2528407 RepID=A0AAV9WX12_9PEZI